MKRIKLVDGCLILFMAVCMIQSVYILFGPAADNPEITPIDVVVRTTAAAIFGYFLSANFIKKNDKPTLNRSEQQQEEPIITQPIGFISESSTPTKQLGSADPESSHRSKLPQKGKYVYNKENVPESSTSRQQIIIAAAVGLTSLSVLLAARNFTELTPSTISPTVLATISQLRDFVSGCVGFLLGFPSNAKHT